MQKRTIIKLGVGLAVSAGVGVIVGSAIKRVTPDDLNRIQKITTQIGAGVLVAMATGMATDYVEDVIDRVADALPSKPVTVDIVVNNPEEDTDERSA